MKLFRQLLIFIVLVVSSTAGLLQAKQTEDGITLNILNTTAQSTTLEYILGPVGSGYTQREIEVNGIQCIFYDIPGAVWLMEKGLPQIPTLRKSIVIPDLSAMNYRIVEQEFTTIQTLPVMPSKGHFTRDIDPASVAYTFDAFYQTDEWYPSQNFSLDVPYIVRDLRGMTLQFNPMQFNPALGELKICTRMVVEVFSDINLPVENPLNRVKPFIGISRDFDDIYNTLFVNYGYPNYDYNPIPEPGRLLIIYPSTFTNQVVPYANWKIAKGIPTLLAEYPTQTGTGSAAIKTYIQNLYNSADGLTYIVLVGEAAQIPTLYGQSEGAASDPCYVKLAGSDAYPDAYISRISPTSANNLSYILWKLKKYEVSPDPGVLGAWYLKGTGVASNEGSPPDWQRANLLRTMLMENMHFTLVDQIYDPGATGSLVSTSLNDGRSVVNYIGHGSGTSWTTSGFNNSQIHQLQNGYKNPFIIDVACLNGDFEMTECMEEAWIRAGDSVNAKGAIAVYGSSTNASWVPPCDMQSHSMDLMTNRERQTVGGVCFNGVMYAMDLWGGSSGEGLKLMEQYNIFGDCTTLMTFGLYPDSTAPDPITDLAASNPTSNSVTLVWTSPFDSSLGGVASYDFRYSTTPIITDDDYNAALSIIIPGEPDSAGMAKSYILGELPFNTLYYFAIKASDMWGNKSIMSNVPFATTLGVPLIAVTPDSMHCFMVPDTLETEIITLSNASTANSTLDYSVALENNTFPGDVSAHLVMNKYPDEDRLNGREVVKQFYGGSIRGSGGPDLFGYEWIDSDDPNGPDFEWNDISTTGTFVNNWVATSTWPAVDEGKAGPFQLGFNFKYYGVPQTQLWCSSNGWLSFTDFSDAGMTNGTIPSTTQPNGIISPLWDDLDGNVTGKVYYKQEDNRFIIQYSNWPGYSSGVGPFTFQVILYKSGKIMIYYKTIMGTSNACSVGIENQAGNDGLQVAYNSTYVKNNLALQFSAEPDWLAASPVNGIIYNGNSVDLILDLNTDDLELGEYSMDIVISSNDPVSPEVIVPVAMTVGITPVELSTFTAEALSGEVVLHWTTATETNNRGFRIERNNNEGKWIEAGFVNGKGTTTEQSVYSFREKMNKPGKYLYRLVQLDYNGKSETTGTVEVLISGPKAYSLYQNYPNPFNPVTTIKFALPYESRVQIIVHNILGEVVEVIVDKMLDAGYHETEWRGAGFSSGIYFYTITAEPVNPELTGGSKSFKSVKKMILMR